MHAGLRTLTELVSTCTAVLYCNDMYVPGKHSLELRHTCTCSLQFWPASALTCDITFKCYIDPMKCGIWALTCTYVDTTVLLIFLVCTFQPPLMYCEIFKHTFWLPFWPRVCAFSCFQCCTQNIEFNVEKYEASMREYAVLQLIIGIINSRACPQSLLYDSEDQIIF
jgi:hypothetical protein